MEQERRGENHVETMHAGKDTISAYQVLADLEILEDVDALTFVAKQIELCDEQTIQRMQI